MMKISNRIFMFFSDKCKEKLEMKRKALIIVSLSAFSIVISACNSNTFDEPAWASIFRENFAPSFEEFSQDEASKFLGREIVLRGYLVTTGKTLSLYEHEDPAEGLVAWPIIVKDTSSDYKLSQEPHFDWDSGAPPQGHCTNQYVMLRGRVGFLHGFNKIGIDTILSIEVFGPIPDYNRTSGYCYIADPMWKLIAEPDLK